MEIDIRKFENDKKYGYLFFISYNGKDFVAFDENTGKKTVKSEFKKVLEGLGITWAKGLQQAARTDAKVNADENVLYISTYFNGDIEELKGKMNKLLNGIKVNKIEKTFSDLVIPDLVKRRIYHYNYPKDMIELEESLIKERAEEISGNKDFSEFTDFNGKQLKQLTRDVLVEYTGETLVFNGESFLPKQVRIMSAYILSGEKKIFPAKYLSLKQLIFKDELNEIIFKIRDDIKIDNVDKIEQVGDMIILYVKKDKRGELIGRRGKNIKILRKIYKEVVVKDV